jgi:hypothetical protein
MRRGGGRSWQVAYGEAEALVHALYAREVSGLAVDMPYQVPPLTPPVGPEPGFARYATAEVAAGWADWWQAEAALGLAPIPQEPEFWFAGSGVCRDLRALLLKTAESAREWGRINRERRELHQPSAGVRVRRTSVAKALVSEAESAMESPAAPFRLQISVLPVAGVWGHKMSDNHVLVSGAMRHDDDALTAFLRPVIRNLA